MKELMVKIVKFHPVAQRGDYRIVDCLVEEVTTNKQFKVGIFMGSEEWSFNEGDVVVMDVKEGKPYKGNPTYSSNIDGITLSDKPSIKEMYKKEIAKDPIKEEPQKVAELSKEVAEQNLWELYFQRLEQILNLFSEKKIPSDTSLAGAILGLRELMLNKRF